jgi:hypothetical protein
MSGRQVSIDELIAVWLLREKEGALAFARQFGLLRRFGLSEQSALAMINEPNYSNARENHIHWSLLQFRYPLLHPLCAGIWREETMLENRFKNLMAINQDRAWIILSDKTGKLSTVATNAYKADYHSNDKEINGMKRTIKRILSSKIDTTFFIMKIEESELMTILEGNKNAVALYIRDFVERKGTFEPFKFFMGHLASKSFWQW